MNIFALDQNGSLLAATDAWPHKNYFCPECHGVLRIRLGAHRRAHFYHLNPPLDCRQNGKSLKHLKIQQIILEKLGLPFDQMEVYFKEIGKIADLVWLEKRVIFEVQCSFITPQEVLCRQRLYQTLGFTVIWVLHESRFGKKPLTQTPFASLPCFYTDVDPAGEGGFYLKTACWPKIPLDLTCIKQEENLPFCIDNLKKRWPIPFTLTAPLFNCSCKQEAVKRKKNWYHSLIDAFLKRFL